MNIVDIQQVTKRYANFTAIDNMTFSIREGTVFGLLGPNGAGKTTLIRMLTQITCPDAGTILFRKHPLQADDIRQIGYLPEERGLYQKMKVGEEAVYLSCLKGLSKTEAVRHLKLKLEQYKLLDWWNRPVEELSKGMQQKLQFIITTLHKPPFLILDEPFSGFDPINTNLLKEDILNLKKEGTTIILSTHNMASVEEICDEILLINKARKILEGHLHEVKNRFKRNQYDIDIQVDDDKPLTDRLQTDFKLLQHRVMPHAVHYAIMIPQNRHVNDLLHLLTQYGSLISFQEVLPTMNEIFIEQVASFNHQNGYE